MFVEGVVKTKVKRKSKMLGLAHSILAAVKPGSLMSPVQLGIAVTAHHLFMSAYLNKMLSSFGYASSYLTTLNFEKSAAVTQSKSTCKPGDSFGQFIADNVDDNPDTLHGKDSVHAMGIMVAMTPGVITSLSIKKETVSIDKLKSMSDGNIQVCMIKESKFLKNVKFLDIFGDIPSLTYPESDLLYITSAALGAKTPLWSGTMQAMTRGPHPKPSSFHFLPLINLQPSSIDCVYSTLVYIKEECKKMDCYPVVTFDQPLYFKAMSLTKAQDSDVSDIFVRLGTFHLMMSILACIGYIMKGSGLEEVIGQCYAEVTVKDIMKGKAFNRAIRAHSIVHRALFYLLIEDKVDSTLTNDEKISLVSYHQRLSDKEDPCEVKDLEEQELFEKLRDIIHEAKVGRNESKTSKLWLQYLDMLDILFELYRGERIGDVKQSTSAKKHILPYLAAGDDKIILLCVSKIDFLIMVTISYLTVFLSAVSVMLSKFR